MWKIKLIMKIQDKARKEIQTVKHGVNLKEIERLQRIIKKLAKHIDKHEQLCEEQEKARGSSLMHHDALHRLAKNPQEPCSFCVSSMQRP